ncbi:hypothetical protein A2U01_0038945, partial [Trifolium medium]|nr:hypothetical protein [Trifolium medium]
MNMMTGMDWRHQFLERAESMRRFCAKG